MTTVLEVDIQGLQATTARFGVDCYLVSFAGELDLHTRELAEQRLRSVLEQGARRLIVDLLGITFLGSAGLTVLAKAAKAARSAGGECIVICDDPRILRVFQITGLDRSFRIDRSLMEAVEELVGITKERV
jgi:anti-sigma B factor antagonist